jgi:hypothetical protein
VNEGDGILVTATVFNNADKAIYVCTHPVPHWTLRSKGPYVHYGGAQTVVVYWGMIHWPDLDFHEEAYAMLGASVRRVEPGAKTTLTHRLGPVVRERNACLRRLYDPCLTEYGEPLFPLPEKELPKPDTPDFGNTLAVRKVMVVIGYWEEEIVWRRSGRAPEHSYLTAGLDHITDLRKLPTLTYRQSVARAIDAQRPWFCRLMSVQDLQLMAIAGPVPLPRPIVFEAEEIQQ